MALNDHTPWHRRGFELLLAVAAAGGDGLTCTADSGLTPKTRSSIDDVPAGAAGSGLLVHRRAARKPRSCTEVMPNMDSYDVRIAVDGKPAQADGACASQHEAAKGQRTLLVSRCIARLIDSHSSTSRCS